MNVAPRGIDAKNFAEGRQGHRVQALVIHIMEGSMEGTLAWFRNPTSRVSSHYGVSRKGEVVQYVDDDDTAYHAGNVDRPTADLVKQNAGVNPNLWTIGIEHEGKADQEPTAAQMVASAELVAALCLKHSIPIDEKHVIPHHAIRASKPCPGKISVKELVTLARGASQPVTPRVGDRRFSPYLGENVIITEYVADDDWHFIRESQLRGLGQRATTRLSLLPSR